MLEALRKQAFQDDTPAKLDPVVLLLQEHFAQIVCLGDLLSLRHPPLSIYATAQRRGA